jgi:protein-disulfide isomerase
MTRTRLGALAALAATLASGCGGEAAPVRTDSTTRSLLDQQSSAVGGPSTPLESDASVSELTARATRVYIPELGHNLGRAEAPLKLIEFSDFGCGYCRRFHEESFPTLAAQFVEPGFIEWKFMPFITGMFDNSLAVTEAAECTLEQSAEGYEAFAARLWDGQGEWKASNEPEALARRWAEELGADIGRYDSCMAEDRRIERVAGATVAAQQLGVRGTPTFWIVGYGPLQGALPLDVFQGILTTVLAEVEAAADSAAAANAPADSIARS